MFTPIENFSLPVVDEFNKNEINIEGLKLISHHEGRRQELESILEYINELAKPTKQMQDLRDNLEVRLSAYKREAPL
jgi:hypothetical protein